MVNTINNNASSSSTNETQKQRKKQAKREAKAMLAVEQAKQDVQRAEQKVAKFQARLEARVAHLRTLEAKLARMRTSPQGPETGTSGGGVDGHQEQPEPAQETTSAYAGGSEPFSVTEEDQAATEAPVPASSVNTSPPADQEVSLPPAEGRADILSDQEPAPTDSQAPTATSTASDTSMSLPEERTETPQQEGPPPQSEDDADGSGQTPTQTAQPVDEARKEVLGTEENFQWWAGSENTTSAYNATSASPDSQEQETQEALGSPTKQLRHTEEKGEWQPEENASQDTDTDY